MSSSELIIRQSRPGHSAGDTTQAPMPVVDPRVHNPDNQGSGSVIRGRRFGLGSGPLVAPDGFGWPGPSGRDVAQVAVARAGDVAGAGRAAGGTLGTSGLQVDLNDLRQRAEDRGYATGRARAEAELAAAIEATRIMAERIEAMAPRDSHTVAQALVALSTAIARRIVGAELHLDPTLLVGALESAVTAINGSPEARVLLHPTQLAPVKAAWEAAHGTAFLGKRWTFEVDTSLPPGGCVLRYEHGFVAAGLEAQLDLISAALEDAIPGLRPANAANDEVQP